eukprot:1157626-Pelagomonas_calceolata.AAC.11
MKASGNSYRPRAAWYAASASTCSSIARRAWSAGPCCPLAPFLVWETHRKAREEGRERVVSEDQASSMQWRAFCAISSP